MLGATVQNSGATMPWRPGVVHPCLRLGTVSNIVLVYGLVYRAMSESQIPFFIVYKGEYVFRSRKE